MLLTWLHINWLDILILYLAFMFVGTLVSVLFIAAESRKNGDDIGIDFNGGEDDKRGDDDDRDDTSK